MSPNWLIWARELQALAQTGLAYTKDPFDRDRFTAIQRVAARMMAEPVGADAAEVERIFAAERGYATPKIGVRAAVFPSTTSPTVFNRPRLLRNLTSHGNGLSVPAGC